MSTEMLNNDQVKIFNNKKQVDPEQFTKETVFVNLWKGLSWVFINGNRRTYMSYAMVSS